jgi:opacity protein-like surface antigen
MKTKTAFLLGILTAIAVASVEAKPLLTTNTLSFSGASWNDGGSLDGYFTIEYNGGTPDAVLSLDVTTGNGTSDGFIGCDYIYNVSGQADTVSMAYIQNTQSGGSPANELMAWTGSYNLYLDWQGSSPTSLYAGDIGDQHSSEWYSGAPETRSITDEGGLVGEAPEPTTLALAGLGGASLLLFRRRK